MMNICGIDFRKMVDLLFLSVVFLIRVFFLSVNAVEVGDSYNLLSAAEALRQFSYPLAEKRLPLFPFLLALNTHSDMVLWGRLLALSLSGMTIGVALFCARRFSFSTTQRLSVLCLICTQPVYAYWSGRIMTDVLFGFLLLCLGFVLSTTRVVTVSTAFQSGVLVGLLMLTRYEGFLLLPVVFLLLQRWGDLRAAVLSLLPAGLLFVPWVLRSLLLFGSPFSTAYTSEVASTLPSPQALVENGAYLLFLFGPFTALLLYRGVQRLWRFQPRYVFFSLGYLLCLLPVVLLWAAAMPRLLFSLIPLFSPIVVAGLEGATTWRQRALMAVSLCIMSVVGIFLHMEFLSGSFATFLLVLLLFCGWFAILLATSYRQAWFSIVLVVIISVSQALVAGAVMYRAQMRGSTTLSAVQFATNLPEGTIGFADETGISSWYLRTRGKYWSADTGYVEAMNWMREEHIRYLVLTNEHAEEGATFLVVYDIEEKDKFKRLARFERHERVDPLNWVIFRMLGRTPPQGEVKYSEVYEILQYREARL